MDDPCRAAGLVVTTPPGYTDCPNEATTTRYLVAHDYAMAIRLCDPHTALWDNDFGAPAITAGEAVNSNTRFTL